MNTELLLLADLFRRRTRPLPGGHLAWTGIHNSQNSPTIKHGRRYLGAHGVAFRLHYGRDPIGRVQAVCSVPGCVAGPCQADRPMREANRRADRAFTKIFGEAA